MVDKKDGRCIHEGAMVCVVVVGGVVWCPVDSSPPTAQSNSNSSTNKSAFSYGCGGRQCSPNSEGWCMIWY